MRKSSNMRDFGFKTSTETVDAERLEARFRDIEGLREVLQGGSIDAWAAKIGVGSNHARIRLKKLLTLIYFRAPNRETVPKIPDSMVRFEKDQTDFPEWLRQLDATEPALHSLKTPSK